MCFVWISEQTAIISLRNINWPVFVMEADCGLCEVRTAIRYAAYGSGSQSPGPHRGGTCSIPCHSLRDVRWMKCQQQYLITLHTRLRLHFALTRRKNWRSLGGFKQTNKQTNKQTKNKQSDVLSNIGGILDNNLLPSCLFSFLKAIKCPGEDRA